MVQPWAAPPPQPPRPPQSIKVLGTLNLVFAGLGLLGLLMTYALYFSGAKFGPPNPVVEAARDSPAYMSFLRWSFVVGAVRIALLGAAGFGLLRLRMWGRKLTMFYGIYGLVDAVVMLVATQHYLAAALSHSSEPGASAGIAGGYIGGVMGAVYPIILLYFMTRPHVREAFARANEPPIPPARVQ